MFIFLCIFASFFAVISLIVFLTSLEEGWSGTVKFSSIVFSTCVGILLWCIIVAWNYNPTPIIHYTEIIRHNNSAFYNVNGRIIQLYGDAGFVNEKETVVRITNYPPSWFWGIYMNPSADHKLVFRSSVTEQPENNN